MRSNATGRDEVPHRGLHRRVASSTHGSPLVWIIVAVLGVIVASIIWRLPTVWTDTVQRPVAIEVEFDYSATTDTFDPIHRGQPIRFGDSVFLELTDAVEARVRVGGLRAVLGASAMVHAAVVLESQAGWTQTLVDIDPISLGPAPTVIPVVIDFARAIDVARRIEQATGIGGALTVEVVTTVELDDGRRDSTRVRFDLNDRRAQLAEPFTAAATAPSSALSTAPSSALSTTSNRSVEGPETGGGSSRMLTWNVEQSIERPGSIEIGPFAARLAVARPVIAAMAAIAVFMALLSVAVAWRARHRGEASWLVARHRTHLVEVGQGFEPPGDVIALGSFDDLVCVGADAQQTIMFDNGDDDVVFYVFDGAHRYCYRAAHHRAHRAGAATPIAPPPFVSAPMADSDSIDSQAIATPPDTGEPVPDDAS